ncbi:uncharacterized protein BDV17DRAFT_286142 [Aspergillus undulatus]|uniref:uncharacterized protein n=1 Tax=Aspergillus undulatus TaxID=1810928 RepID=UPI003CCDF45C
MGQPYAAEITALSQRTIDEAMKKLLEKHPELTDVDVRNRSGHELTATIGQPLVSLKAKGASRADLEYTCQLASGSDWTVAFNVKIGAKVLGLRMKGMTQHERQLSSLMITRLSISLSDLMKEKSQNLNGCDFNGVKLDKFELLDFCSLLAPWYISSDPSTIIPQAPELVPTSMRFQTYEYKAAGQDDPDERVPDGDNNTLLYIQMTKDEPFPENEILPYNGNFTTNEIPGMMCIRRDLFWENYLLRVKSPLLQLLNRTTYVWVKSHSVPSMHDPKRSEQPFEAAVLTGCDEGATYDELPVVGPYKHADINYGDDTDNTVSAKPGINTINVAGTSNVFIKADAGSSGWGYWYKIRATLTWESQITIAAGDAGLEISLNVHDDSLKVTSPVPEWRDKVRQKIKDSLHSNNLQDAEKKLQSELTTAARLVVPGRGTFSYRSPVFNNRGNLMIEINYED